jgi:hypothetical protein
MGPDRLMLGNQPAGGTDLPELLAAGIESNRLQSRCSLSSKEWELVALMTVVVAGDIVGGPI